MRLFPEAFQIFILKRLAELGGILSLAIGGFILISIISYSSYDPTINNLSGQDVTNLGGSLLSIISSNVHSDKNVIRYNISSGYFIFALFQLLLINIFFNQINFDYLKFIWLPIIIFTLSQRLFKKMNDVIYYTSLNIFTLFYGIYIFADIIYSYFVN